MSDPIFFANVILAIQKSGLNRNQKDVLSALCGLVDWSTWSRCVPARYIAIRASVSTDTVHRSIREMDAMGLVSYTHGKGETPEWQVNAQAIVDLPTGSLKVVKRAFKPKDEITATQDPKPTPKTASATATPTLGADTTRMLGAASMSLGAETQTHGAACSTLGAAASPILLSDPPTQSISSNPVRTPMSPSGSNVVGLFADTQKPPKRGKAVSVPAPLPERVANRDDAVMWSQIWPSLTKAEQARIWEAVELWDKFTDVFQRIKNATLEDVRAMLQIRSTGIYTLDDLHEGIQGVFVMASEKGGQWVYSSGAFMPRKLFSEKGKLEQGRQIWANVTGAKHSKTDDLGRMQHGFTMSEHDFFYGPGGKK